MSRRLKLHSILCGILSCPERGKECRAYFQPPASVSMKYPAIVYALNGKDKRHANDRVYLSSNRYSVTVIDSNPDSDIVDNVISSSSNRSILSSDNFFNSPSGTDSVLAPWITFSTPNTPFSCVQRSTKSFALYSAATRFDSGDVIIKDGTGGTKKMTAANAAVEFAGLVSAINHRNVYRGKNLGSSVTAAQKAAIQNGTFDDLFIGDYWVIGGVTWVIADMDYFLRCGDTDFTKHHLVIVPASSLYNGQMNATNTTEGGYVGSVMYKTGLDNAKAKFKAAFGSMLLTHRTYLVNAVANGKPSGGAWFDETVALMNEVMVYGTHFFEPANDGTTIPTKYSVCNSQLALMQLNPKMIKTRETYWLQNVVSSADFARVNYYGLAGCYYASVSVGVRPYGIIG